MLSAKDTAVGADAATGGDDAGADVTTGFGGAAAGAGPEREVAHATTSAAIENAIGCRACIAGPQLTSRT
jgi:hypothetical protein